MVFAVMYRIDTSKKDYSGLYEKIKSFGAWMHYLDSSWLIAPDAEPTAKEVYDELIPLISGENDYLLVFEVKKQWQGWLPKDADDWLQNRSYG